MSKPLLEGAIQTALAEHTGNGFEQAVELLLEPRSDTELSGESLWTPMGVDRGDRHAARGRPAVVSLGLEAQTDTSRARSRLPSSSIQAMPSSRR